MNLTKTLLLTGASTGLGLSVAVKSALAGYRVYATMRDLGKSDALRAALSSAGATAEILPLDVQDTASIEVVVAQILREESRIDVLVNNAGVGFVRSTEQASEADVEWVLDVNLKGVIRCTKAVLPHMRVARSGRVVTISSIGGLVGQPFNEIYCASKFAVEGYMESLASYVGPAFGIGFTVVEPGGISSEFANNAMKQVMASGGILEDEYKPLIERYMGSRTQRPEGVFQTPDEVADVVMGCLSAETPPVRLRTSAWSEDVCDFKTAGDPDGTKLRAKVIDMFLGGQEGLKRT